MRGSVWKRCPCGDTGTAGKPACRKPHGSWYFRADADPDATTGSRRQPSKGGFRTRDAAQDALDAFKASGAKDDRGLTVGEWFELWLADCKARLSGDSLGLKTYTGYESAFRIGIKPYLGEHRLRDLRRRHVEAWITQARTPVGPSTPVDRDRLRQKCTAGPDETTTGHACRKWALIGKDRCELHGGGTSEPKRGRIGRVVETRSAGTLSGYRRVLRNGLAAAVREELIPSNPAEGRIVAMPKDGPTEASVWQPEQVLDFLLDAEARVAATTPGTHEHFVAARDDALWEVAAFAGPRRGELDGMRWAHVDLDSAHPGIDLGPTIVQVQGTHRCLPARQEGRAGTDEVAYGCGGMHRGYQVKAGPKSSASWRWVPTVPGAVTKLRGLKAAQASLRDQWGEAYVDHGLVFAREDGNPLYPQDVTDRFQGRAAELGLPIIRLHEMRHGAASLLIAADVPIETVSLILGHAQVSTTRRIYKHVLQGPAMAGMEAAVTLVRGDGRAQIVHNPPPSPPRLTVVR